MADDAHGKTTIVPELKGSDAPVLVFGKAFPSYLYTDLLTQYPTLFCAIYGFIPFLLAVLSFTFTPSLDTSPDAMSIRDHWSAQNMATIDNVRREWLTDVQSFQTNQRAGARSGAPRSQIARRLYLTYEVDPSAALNYNRAESNRLANLLEPENLRYMQSVEQDIHRRSSYIRLCWRAPFRGGEGDERYVDYPLPICTPMTSLLSYYFPGSMVNSTGYPYWEFTGYTGVLLQPSEAIDRIVFQNPRVQWFMDHAADAENRRTSIARTQINLGSPITSSTGNALGSDTEATVLDQFTDDFIDYALSRTDNHPYIRVGFGGDGVETRLVSRAIDRDATLVIPAVILTLLILWYHFHSLLLAAMAVVQIAATYPAGYIIYIGASSRELSLLSTLNVYVILIIATNSMMIFFDTFKQSGFMPTTGRRNLLSISQRVAYAYRKAGVGITVASLVAAACFGITTTSRVPAVSSFAVLMVCLVCVNWLLLMTLFPAMILFHHFHISGRRRNLQRQKEILLARGLRKRDLSMQMYLQETEELNKKHGGLGYKELVEFMKEKQGDEANGRSNGGGVWSILGIQAPVRVRNPFNRTQGLRTLNGTDGGEHAGGDAPNPAVDMQDFIDQFQDANDVNPTSPQEGDGNGKSMRGRAPGVGIIDHRNADVKSVLRIRNINTQEAFGFDDTPLRCRLVEFGGRTAADFSESQLDEVAPLIGIEPLGPKAAGRVFSVARTAMYLLYGNARCIPPHATMAEQLQQHQQQNGPNGGGGADYTEPPQQQQPQHAAQAGAAAGAIAAAGNGRQRGPRFGFSQRVADWWQHRKTVPRKWCCGLIGQRVGESKEEEEARIMSKKIKHEGYSRAELLFYNKWAPAVNFLRFPLIVIMLAWVILAIIFAVRIEPSAEAADLLGSSSAAARYDALLPRFGQEGQCDTCSAYFQPITAFPRPNPTAVTVCSLTKYDGEMITAWLDNCGVCEGNNSCYDCSGVPNGNFTRDRCGKCVAATDQRYDDCMRCKIIGNIDGGMQCSECTVRLDAPVGLTGPNCDMRCDDSNCNPNGGSCNAVTGECRCFGDYDKGFWRDDPSGNSGGVRCSVCHDLMSGPKCNVECSNAAVSPCNCNTARGKCTGCIAEVYGQSCVTPNPTNCNPDHGYVSGVGCSCNAGWDSSLGCNYESQCSGHGTYYTAAQLPAGSIPGCKCLGQWRGPACQYCRCYNGGECTANGTCVCTGGFSGEDCQLCPETCTRRGSCPDSLPPELYPTRTCRALFCNATELDRSVALTESCRRCDNSGIAPGCGFPTRQSCEIYGTCRWDLFTNSCRRQNFRDEVLGDLPSNYTDCRCNGYWSGAVCTVCNNVSFRGTHCAEYTGELLGCDGRGPDASGQYKVIDACGTCGGSTTCTGCDGIPGSGKRVDVCGVCGGNNECPAGAALNGGQIVRPSSEIRIMFGMNPDGTVNGEFDFTDPDFLEHLFWICLELTRRGDLTKTEQTRCFMADFITDLRLIEIVPYPIPEVERPNLARYVYNFVVRHGRFDEVGFSSPDPNSLNFHVKWVLVYVRANGIYDNTPESKQNDALDLWGRIMNNINKPSTRGAQGEAFMSSEAWRRTFTQRAYKFGATFVLVAASIAFIGLILAVTCSPTLTVICGFTLLSHILSVLGIFRMLGWEIGPIQLVAIALLLGLSCEQLMHMSEAYLEFLHAAQSTMFARETTRLQAVKGMYQRTGVSSLLSGVTILVASAFLFAGRVLVIRRVAGVMFVLILTNIIHTLIFMGALLCVFGPTTSYRNRRTAAVFAALGSLAFVVIFLVLYFTKAISVV